MSRAVEGGQVAIAIPDGTRHLDVVSALRALAGWAPEMNAAVVVGLGLHRPMRDDELAPLRAACPWPVLNHDPDGCVALGEIDGAPLQIHPLLAEADLRILVGIVELHQYAGFSGGWKAAAVGCGGRDTLAALHARALVCDPRVQVGRLDGNPFRERVDALGEALGPGMALQAIPDGRWLAGPPRATLRAAADAQAPWYTVDRRYDRCLLRVPTAKAVNVYQASRAATYLALSPRPPLVDGATLVLDAACPEGAGAGSGERAFAALMRRAAPPWGELLTGPVPSGAGVQRAFTLARLAARYRLVVAGCDDPAAIRAIGIEATDEPAAAVAGPDALLVERPFERLPQRPR